MKVPCPHCGVYVVPKNGKCEACGGDLPDLKAELKPDEILEPVNENLVPCQDCSRVISKNAEACPFCGAPVKNFNMGCLGVFIAVILIAMLISLMDGSKETTKTTSAKQAQSELTEQEKEQKRIQREKERAEEYERCKTDLHCWGNKHSLRATVASQDLIEKLAKYDFEWTDGWLGAKISEFRWLDKNKLTLTYFGDKIKFQNGFGAWQNMIYQCDYDPINERVLNVVIRPGRL